jgi:hypothetical protein
VALTNWVGLTYSDHYYQHPPISRSCRISQQQALKIDTTLLCQFGGTMIGGSTPEMSIFIWQHIDEKTVSSWPSRCYTKMCANFLRVKLTPCSIYTAIIRNMGFLSSIRVLCLFLCPVNRFLRVPYGVIFGFLRVFWNIWTLQKESYWVDVSVKNSCFHCIRIIP